MLHGNPGKKVKVKVTATNKLSIAKETDHRREIQWKREIAEEGDSGRGR